MASLSYRPDGVSEKASAECVGFAEPAEQLIVNILRRGEFHLAVIPVLRYLLGFGDAAALNGVIGAQVEDEIALARVDACEAHRMYQMDGCFLRLLLERADLPQPLQEARVDDTH